jgi:hypothetical protein
MTSREHARRLMLILLSGQTAGDAGSAEQHTGKPADDRQATDGRDDSTEGDERRTSALVDGLILT